jgi:hypothetical protein
MASPWLRLWSDMPNDPKFRTIARISKQSISSVIAVYVHMLCCASNATERGRTQGWDDEDIASALDMDCASITAIRDAMEGKLIEGDWLTGWDKRQPKKEDGAAERAKEWREKKAEEERNRTQPNATERQEIEERRGEVEIEEISSKAIVPSEADDDAATIAKPEKPDCPHQEIIAIYHEVLPQCPRIREWTPARATQLRTRWNENSSRQNLDYWRQFFEYVAQCDFLVGRAGKTPFFADLEWMTKIANFTKIREQKYETRTT